MKKKAKTNASLFRKLRTRLILINVGITSVIIISMFATIYVVTTTRTKERIPEFQQQILSQNNYYADDFVKILETEEQKSSDELLLVLIISGLIVEVAVAFISYYLADEAIKPVREAYETQKTFIANASHEIKTPVAAIAANLEAADIEGNRFIDNAIFETEKLSRLNSELLTLVRTDTVSKTETKDFVPAKSIEDTLKALEPRLKDKTMKLKILSRDKVKLNKADFDQIFGILIDNAIKYSDKKIIVEVGDKKIVVRNDGTVLTDEAKAKIFDRFYQADKSAEGVGLGLSIAKAAADRNSWKLTASAEKGMTNFTLVFKN